MFSSGGLESVGGLRAMQLNYPPLLFTAFLAIASAQAFGQEKDLLSAEYSKCIEQSGGTDPGMLDCIGAEGVRQDKRLNDVYKTLMNKLKPERKRELQEAQRLWIKYTEANCNFYLDPDGGTAARLAASECPVLAKAARVKELENFLQ
jgi:uncharacterized protein YecT (DUF1311 family)